MEFLLYGGKNTATERQHWKPAVWSMAKGCPHSAAPLEGWNYDSPYLLWRYWIAEQRQAPETLSLATLLVTAQEGYELGLLHLEKLWEWSCGNVLFAINVYKYLMMDGKDWATVGCSLLPRWRSLTWSPCLESTVPAVTWCSVTLPFSSEGSWREGV